MRVLKDNSNNNYVKRVKSESTYPKKMLCENCSSELEYDESDMRIGALGCVFVDCPCCGRETFIDEEEGVSLTKDNVEFPTHFFHISKETGAVDCCNSEEVKKEIRRGIDFLRNNRDEFGWHTQFGNLYVCVNRFEGDEVYNVIVSNNYYETDIPFESEDY